MCKVIGFNFHPREWPIGILRDLTLTDSFVSSVTRHGQDNALRVSLRALCVRWRMLQDPLDQVRFLSKYGSFFSNPCFNIPWETIYLCRAY